MTGRRTEMRVSYFREICTNGLMGWADDHYTIDEYLAWLAASKPTKHRKIQQECEAELVERTDHRPGIVAFLLVCLREQSCQASR